MSSRLSTTFPTNSVLEGTTPGVRLLIELELRKNDCVARGEPKSMLSSCKTLGQLLFSEVK